MSQYNENPEVEDVRECEAMRKVFVGGLNGETTDEAFLEYFSQFGSMADNIIMRDQVTKASKRFGFITYDHVDSVENVFSGRPHVIDGKTLDVKRAMPKNVNNAVSHLKTTKLFIGGISEDLTPEELQTYLEERHPSVYGSIDKIDFLKERETNKNKGFGFLECSSTDFADRIVICEASFQLNGKKMSIKKAEPKDGSTRNRGGMRGGRGGNRGGYNNGQQQNGSYGGYANNQGYQQNYYAGYQQQQQQYSNMGYGNQQYGGYGGQQQSGWGNNRFQPY